MTRARSILRFSLCLAASAAAAGPVGTDAGPVSAAFAAEAPRARPGMPIERSADFLSSVSRAIDRGVEHLRTLQEADGGFGVHRGYPCGLTALAYHTLRTCGVPETDPACVRAWAALKREYADAKKAGELRTYSAGLTMLAIADHALLWTPDRTKDRKAAPARLGDESDRTWMNELVAYLENCQSVEGGWRYGETQPYGRPVRRSGDYDHSNTQYAAQGLRAASLLGCEVKAETWRRLARHLLDTQGPAGPEVSLTPPLAKGQTGAAIRARARGWSYFDASGAGQDPYGSMTAGALASLVIARNELRTRGSRDAALVRECEDGIRGGLAWLAVHLDVRDNPGRRGWHFYWLYALERAGDLSDAEWMGDRDWYGEGATLLVGTQEPGGRWREAGPEVAAQSWALLFLRRGARVLETLTPGGAEAPVRFEGAATLPDRDFEDLVDLAVQRWRRATTDAAREALAAGAASAGARIVAPLLVRMDSPDAGKRRAAHGLLARITGVGFPFDPDAGQADRSRALAEFEGWYLRSGSLLRHDASRGRLIEG